MDTKILLDSGTNELEVLEFTLGEFSYGINVAKIKEIISYQDVTPVPNSHPSIEGVFMPRETMITAIDLKNCLGRGQSEPGGLFIITNFNNLNIAFPVESGMADVVIVPVRENQVVDVLFAIHPLDVAAHPFAA